MYVKLASLQLPSSILHDNSATKSNYHFLIIGKGSRGLTPFLECLHGGRYQQTRHQWQLKAIFPDSSVHFQTSSPVSMFCCSTQCQCHPQTLPGGGGGTKPRREVGTHARLVPAFWGLWTPNAPRFRQRTAHLWHIWPGATLFSSSRCATNLDPVLTKIFPFYTSACSPNLEIATCVVLAEARG